MRKYIIPFIILVVLCSCDEDIVEEQQQTEDIVVATQEDVGNLNGFYKRYTGTIANMPVTVNLIQYGSSFTGMYYYDKIGSVINLFGAAKPDSTTGEVTLIEADETQKEGRNGTTWKLNINEATITGVWLNNKNKETYEINLKEDYTNAIKLGVLYKTEQRHYKEGEEEPYATNEYQYIFPALKDGNNAYLYTVLSKLVDCKVDSRNSLEQCIDKKNEAYFKFYLQDLADIEEQGVFERGYSYNYAATEHQYVYYNSNGWLCVCEHLWSFTGGAHGNYNSTFSCIDLQGYNIWTLDKVVNDKKTLLAILERDVRKQFAISKKQPLNSRLLIDELHVTDNFFLTDKGLTFVYTPYEIASYADGEVSVFVPYTKINHLLTPAFKDRMHLNDPV